MENKSTVYYKINPTNVLGSVQELLLVEQEEDKYGLASCPRHRIFMYLSETDMSRLCEEMNGEGVVRKETSTPELEESVSKLIKACYDTKDFVSFSIVDDFLISLGFKKK